MQCSFLHQATSVPDIKVEIPQPLCINTKCEGRMKIWLAGVGRFIINKFALALHKSSSRNK